MGKTKYFIIIGILLVVAMAIAFVLALRMEPGMDRMWLLVCLVALLLLSMALCMGAYRVRKNYNYWKKRYDTELLTNVNELMEKTTEIAELNAKIDRLTHEIDRLGRVNSDYERTASSLRLELGSTRDKFDECCKLLADLRERAEQGDKMKASFLANVTHELRTPLNSVLGYGAIINNPIVSEKRRRHFMNVLQKSCDRFLDTLNDMLYYSQLQSGDIAATSTLFDLTAMLSNLRIMTETKIKESGKDVHVVFNYDFAGKGYICGYEAGYYKLLSCLLDNAVKYTNNGSITVSYEAVDKRGRFVVEDTGVGFDSSKKDTIFGSFNQSEASLSRKYEGTGLGLSICRSLVNLMNGTIEAEGHPGVGSKFTFEIPLLPTAIPDMELYAKVEKILERYNDSGSIMVMSPYVEDYNFVNNFFGSYGIDVVRCRSLEEVEVLVAAKQGLNIAIIDLSTSPADGLAAAGTVFNMNPKVRFAFVRGKELDKNLETKTGLYSNFVIQRPLSSKSLSNLLSTC
ncbi:MAG: HAMP domain-containing histidine kinase [Bacteroidales bacterium]|nr:HAMP domain-containing histidine kinase [Bacteroidales bacterium]